MSHLGLLLYAKAQSSQSLFDASFSLKFKSCFSKTLTFAFIALKPSCQFIVRITFQSVRILKIISCPTFWNVSYSHDYVLPRKF